MSLSRDALNRNSDDLTGLRPLISHLRKLMPVGMGVKRWLLFGAAGVLVCAVGLAYVLKGIFDLSPPTILPIAVEAAVLMIAGVLVLIISIYGLFRSISSQTFSSRDVGQLLDNINSRRTRGRGPKIVVIGGGTGLSVLLRGVKEYTDNITAIVTVADDGGSSGRLRREMGVPPPGDFRNCIVALSDSETLVTDLFQYRFSQGEGLQGHSFGNLFIAAMMDVTGSFDRALSESGKVLAVRGQIVPATVANVRLSARLTDGRIIQGESKIPLAGAAVEKIMLEPSTPAAHPVAIDAIESADVVVVGPGSLFTSILPNLLVPGISSALNRSQATKMYVCNVVTQAGETDGFSVADHVIALQRHTNETIVDLVIAHESPQEIDAVPDGNIVTDDGTHISYAKVVKLDVGDPSHPARHSSKDLAREIMSLYHGEDRLKV